MRLERFEDVDSWKEARVLVAEVYKLLHECRILALRVRFSVLQSL